MSSLLVVVLSSLANMESLKERKVELVRLIMFIVNVKPTQLAKLGYKDVIIT